MRKIQICIDENKTLCYGVSKAIRAVVVGFCATSHSQTNALDFMQGYRFDLSQEEFNTLQRRDKDRFGTALFSHLRRTLVPNERRMHTSVYKVFVACCVSNVGAQIEQCVR